MYRLLRPLLFQLDAEQAHGLTLKLLQVAGGLALSRFVLRRLFAVPDTRLAVDLFGVHFANRVGLAAGYDKNGVAVPGLAALGFGHLELGTITRLPQVGNPRPRVHRVPSAKALINSMGFPNAGVDALNPAAAPVRIGINIGKGKDTPVDQAGEDYCYLLERVYRRADYVTINISSPNTLNLRQLQARAAMEALLASVVGLRNQLTPRIPLLVKIAPDLTPAELDDVIAAVTASGVDGIIATNTTIARTDIPASQRDLKGGMSGAPLRAPATEVIRYLATQTNGSIPIIGVGGILRPEDALEKLDAGAALVQLYTGLIYSGPGLVQQILRALQARAAPHQQP